MLHATRAGVDDFWCWPWQSRRILITGEATQVTIGWNVLFDFVSCSCVVDNRSSNATVRSFIRIYSVYLSRLFSSPPFHWRHAAENCCICRTLKRLVVIRGTKNCCGRRSHIICRWHNDPYHSFLCTFRSTRRLTCNWWCLTCNWRCLTRLLLHTAASP